MNKSNHRVYLDHAATTAVRPEVADAIYEVFKNSYGNPSSFYQEGHEAYHLMEDARKTIAEALNALPEEIYFTSCGTESDNWAIKGTAFALQKKGRHMITSKIEHPAVLRSMEWLEKQGFEVTYLDVDSLGRIDPEDVRKALRDDTILVSIMTANNEIGTIQPIAEIGQICREKKIYFHSDGVQALGAIPIDVKAMNVDMMSFSGHKLYAPKGIGMLYMRKGVRIENLMHGGGQEKRKRPGTENVPYIVGLAKALELAVKEMPETNAKLLEMRDYLMREIPKRIPHTKLNGDPVHRLPNNVNFSFEFIEGESILLLLDSEGYNGSSGSACASASLDPSHVLLAIGLPHEIAHGSLRISLGRENTMDEVKVFADELPVIIERLREMSPLWEDFKAGRIVKPLIP